MNSQKFLSILLISLVFFSCSKRINPLHDIDCYVDDFHINSFVEIPAGTIDKYELDKETGLLRIDSIDGVPRKIEYLPYPVNYGMIPQTYLDKESGGDGDPLDIIILGESISQGSIIKVKPIGVLELLDNNEQDDKIIGVNEESTFYSISSLNELQVKYPEALKIIESFVS